MRFSRVILGSSYGLARFYLPPPSTSAARYRQFFSLVRHLAPSQNHLNNMNLDIPADDSGKLKVTSHAQYKSPSRLSPSSVLPDPIDQFKEWFKAASSPHPDQPQKSVVHEPEAMAISTCSAEGVPSTRFVLLKQADPRGFVFYTNYESRKSNELHANPYASIAFYWREVHRQVRIVGKVEKLDARESDEYYSSRPIGSRMGAWASPQSSVVQDGELDRRLAEVEKRFQGLDGTEVPRPDFWGGWRVVPHEIEFWQGQPSRLHDRVRYLRKPGEEGWVIERIAP
ncbi:Pyridoxamine 5'-phosphate oxidase, partial [Rhizoctonia solani]